MGDAAHPMTSNLGQGACQAIEDAVVLARCLRGVDEAGDQAVAHSLRRYERLLTDRTAMVVRRSRRVGQAGQLENPLLCMLRDRFLKVVSVEAQLRQMQRLVGHEA